MRYYPPCEHPQTARGRVCPVCLRATWKSAAAAIEQAIVARQARGAARKERDRGRSGGAAAAGLGSDTGRQPADARLADGARASLEYVLPPLAEVLKLTQRRSPGPSEPEVSRIYVWGYTPLHTDLWTQQARPSAAAREFAATRGWDATRPGAWALELLLHMSLGRALGELEPVIRRDPAVRGWGGRHSSRCHPQPAPRATLHAAVAQQQRAAQFLCARASTLSTVVTTAGVRQQELTRQVRSQRLERLKRLPPAEFEALNRTLTAAIDLGKAGRLAEGYTLLLSSWHQATAAAQESTPWSGSLRWIYSVALENYVWRYGPSLP